jgi:hypothetical protein
VWEDEAQAPLPPHVDIACPSPPPPLPSCPVRRAMDAAPVRGIAPAVRVAMMAAWLAQLAWSRRRVAVVAAVVGCGAL